MLSILLPIYNYDSTALIQDLYEQACGCSIPFEIIILEDASTIPIVLPLHLQNNPSIYYTLLANNIGRAKIRNLLAQKAHYSYLLYLDGDSSIQHNPDFIKNYVATIQQNVSCCCGGRQYHTTPPQPSYILHWKYGKNREVTSLENRKQNPYACFYSNNFLITKKILLTYPFNEEIKGYGHEDTYFAYTLYTNKISIEIIHNTVIHEGLDSAENFIQKMLHASSNLIYLYEKGGSLQDYLVSNSKLLCKWLEYKNHFMYVYIQKNSLFLQKKMRIHLTKSANPNLRVLDMYRWIKMNNNSNN